MNLGADPEFFIWDLKKAKYVSASEVEIPNGKLDPVMRITTDGMSFYRDGYALEANFLKPHYCRGLMGNAFIGGMTQFLSLPKYLGKFNLRTVPAVPVSLEDLAQLPADVSEFGCAPSKNAWGEELDLTKVDGATHPFRYAGGHLWVSNTFSEQSWLKTDEGIEKFVRAMDYYLGLPFTFIFDRPEAYIRRKMYGRAGDYRTKDFGTWTRGVEYRVLSPEWFNHSSWFSFALGIARFIATRMSYVNHDAIKEKGPQIIQAINTGEGLKDVMPPRLYGFYTMETLEAAKAIKDRFEFKLLSCSDVHHGWDHFKQSWRLPGVVDSWSSIEF